MSAQAAVQAISAAELFPGSRYAPMAQDGSVLLRAVAGSPAADDAPPAPSPAADAPAPAPPPGAGGDAPAAQQPSWAASHALPLALGAGLGGLALAGVAVVAVARRSRRRRVAASQPDAERGVASLPPSAAAARPASLVAWQEHVSGGDASAVPGRRPVSASAAPSSPPVQQLQPRPASASAVLPRSARPAPLHACAWREPEGGVGSAGALQARSPTSPPSPCGRRAPGVGASLSVGRLARPSDTALGPPPFVFYNAAFEADALHTPGGEAV